MVEEPQAYRMADNPCYTVPKKVNTDVYYSTPGQPTSSAGTTAAKTPLKVNKLAIAALISVFFVAVLALSSIIIALVSNFNTKGEDIQDCQCCQDTIINLQDQITKMALDLNSTRSELMVIMRRIGETGDVVGIALPGEILSCTPVY